MQQHSWMQVTFGDRKVATRDGAPEYAPISTDDASTLSEWRCPITQLLDTLILFVQQSLQWRLTTNSHGPKADTLPYIFENFAVRKDFLTNWKWRSRRLHESNRAYCRISNQRILLHGECRSEQFPQVSKMARNSVRIQAIWELSPHSSKSVHQHVLPDRQ